MKELSIEEKAKRFDEAIKKAKSKIKNDKDHVLYEYDVIEMFPELKESREDEMIRIIKEVILNSVPYKINILTKDTTITAEEAIAWLEKQGKNNMGISEATKKKLEDNLNKALEKETPESFNEFLDEQKPAEWSEDDREYMESLLDIINGTPSLTPSEVECHKDWLKSLKDRVQPKQEWSEEDENRINRLIAYFEDKESFTAEDDIVYANWLKSLKGRYTWKPSDEQMDILRKVSTYGVFASSVRDVLQSLYNDLKKL